ncbi:MAG TPA: hypothetical protein VKP65_01175 [Rhodothermales bacterium]|nr:hypothetical protein [Rhodothermales bacterium]
MKRVRHTFALLMPFHRPFLRCAALLLLVLIAGCQAELEYPPGILAPNDPLQTSVGDVPLLSKGDYVIEPLARFEVEARVLSKKRYRSGRESDLSPIDLALGWGPMSDQAVLDQIDISQARRFYFWQATQLPIPQRDISQHSSNMHMIPANDEVRAALLKVRTGEIVRFSGYLVQVRGKDGFRWRSSMKRTDVGNGACELVWVEEILSYEALTPYSL